MDKELERFRLLAYHQRKHLPKTSRKLQRQNGPFIRGPIPLSWLDPVLALALQFQAKPE